jgi:GNAT superfamily N-acetyltransferase
VEVRAAGDGDFAAIAAIAVANGDDAGADARYVSYLLRHGSVLVAELDGEVAGYGATRRIGGATMLCDLFVDPVRHGAGVGGRLLDALFAEPGERFTFASQDPRALPLYVRHGMVPRWPLLYLSGRPTGTANLRHRVVATDEACAAELELTGRDRAADYELWAGAPGAAGLLILDGREVTAAGAIAPGHLVHLASGRDPAATLVAALAAFDREPVRLCLPGPHPALRMLLDARWRIDDQDCHMSSGENLVSPGCVPSPSLA